jgi:ATP-dependent DNA helicase RecG
VRAGRQAFVVCPLVEQSEEPDGGDVKAATAEFERLRTGELSEFRVVLVHGQLPHRSKQAAMSAFAAGEADVLVSTTVIEVGIDVPNATVMLIENAERFGISQLHQLRGRVGRGGHPALCLLCGTKDSPRLAALARHDDGFELAEIDLRLRKQGELIGLRQSGATQFAFARMPDDESLLTGARSCAERLIAADPELEQADNVLLARVIDEHYPEIAARAIPA